MTVKTLLEGVLAVCCYGVDFRQWEQVLQQGTQSKVINITGLLVLKAVWGRGHGRERNLAWSMGQQANCPKAIGWTPVHVATNPENLGALQ